MGMRVAGLTLVLLCPTLFAIVVCEDEERSPVSDYAAEWGYHGPLGPQNWASLSEEYTACGDGKQQSPIDITGYDEGDAEPISFSYDTDATAVRNDGKAVYVDYAPGSTLSVGRRTFELKSGHIHSPSEHRMDGVSLAAELHLVHTDADGQMAVAALLFRLGEPSPTVQAILDAAPAVGGTVRGNTTLNAGGYTPGELGYYRYDGSLTTPPCSEPVEWYVLREPKTISPEQVADLQALSSGPNNRPIQPESTRVIVAVGAS